MDNNQKMSMFISEARKELMAVNSFPINEFPIEMEATEPTSLNTDSITQQLNDLGLTCSETTGRRLEQNINDVINNIGKGSLQSFGVYSYQPASTQRIQAMIQNLNNEDEIAAQLMEQEYVRTAEGNWIEKGTGQFDAKLRVICQKDNYEYLKSNFADFPYCEVVQQTYESQENTVSAIKQFFVNVASSCTASTVEGIDETTLKAVFSNALAMINESTDLSNFSVTNQNRVITLLKDYNVTTKEADGVGIAVCEWDLSITNYQQKKESVRHDTKVTVRSRSVLYRDPAILLKHYNAVKAIYKGVNSLIAQSFQIVSEVQVFNSLPAACEDTFIASLPCESDQDSADVIVLYKGDLQKIGILDNSHSASQSTFTKTMTSGFLMSSTIGFSHQINFEVNAEVVKFGTSISYNISMTEQWSKQNTETISFTVPANQKAYLYQVTILCARLRLDSKTATYRYIDYGKFDTNAYVTSDTPLYENNM